MRSSGAISRVITAGVQLLTGAQARWAGCKPSEIQRIYFVNHTSHFDFLLVLAALPQQLRANMQPVAASDYWCRCAMRQYLACSVFQAVLIERSGGNAVTRCLDLMIGVLDRGRSLILFPEGTRGSGEELGAFKSGIFHLAAARSQVDLVPVWIDNARRIMPKGTLIPVPLLCSVTFGEPLRLREGEPKERFLDRLRNSLTALGGSRET
jgi:1-acyl-sn-glycerol-3-phosphate acyltransferase